MQAMTKRQAAWLTVYDRLAMDGDGDKIGDGCHFADVPPEGMSAVPAMAFGLLETVLVRRYIWGVAFFGPGSDSVVFEIPEVLDSLTALAAASDNCVAVADLMPNNRDVVGSAEMVLRDCGSQSFDVDVDIAEAIGAELAIAYDGGRRAAWRRALKLPEAETMTDDQPAPSPSCSSDASSGSSPGSSPAPGE